MENNTEKFLYRVAKNIKEQGTNFEDTIIILPNKRSTRGLMDALKDVIGNTFLEPEILSISDLIAKVINDTKEAEKLPLIYYLYESYCKIFYDKHPLLAGEEKEPFAEFYLWGEKLLNDFDEIDKNLVNAETIFRNLKDYKDLESIPKDVLSEEQRKTLEDFFKIDFENGKVRKKFADIWNCLLEIYKDFNQKLDEKHLAYSGKLKRRFVESLNKDKDLFPDKKFFVVGFSTLDAAERKLFSILKDNNAAQFYWDIDKYYQDNPLQEAGIFIRDNKEQFKMNKEFLKNNFDRIEKNKQEINIINCAYETASLSYIRKWYEKIKAIEGVNLNECAIILNDESLISLVRRSLPKKEEEKEKVQFNITMGYPFKQSGLYNDVIEIVDKLKEGDFTREKIHEAIKGKAKEKYNKPRWEFDMLKKVDETLCEFADAIKDIKPEDLPNSIIKNVVKQELNSLSIDIESEESQGVQVMGLLETRCLDFQHVLMLSTSDDNLPKLSSNTGFIPNSFKQAYNMMTLQRKAGIFAYYFYRLFHTAKTLDFVYTTESVGGNVKEMSRFLRQIKFELKDSSKTINEINMSANKRYDSTDKRRRLRGNNNKINMSANKRDSKVVKGQYAFKEEEVINDNKVVATDEKQKIVYREPQTITEKTRTISPSALNKLLDCELKFYLYKIKGLTEKDENDDKTHAIFGNVFHEAASIICSMPGYPTISDEEKAIEDALGKALTENKETDEGKRNKREEELKARQECVQRLHQDILKDYLRKLLKKDKDDKVTIIDLEKECSCELKIDDNTFVYLQGRLDRMDTLPDGTLRIVDYKTGGAKEHKFNKYPKHNTDFTIDEVLESMFEKKDNGERKKDGANYLFEICCYCYLVYRNEEKDIQPCLLYLADIDEMAIQFNKAPLVYNREFHTKFEEKLKEHLKKTFDKTAGDFYEGVLLSDDVTKKCDYCDYKILCGVEEKDDD
ncbi:MAG: PD-(D/E)XK nuclease family protein [Bacteroidales bacterium]|nr:PD-(D/E)XK nuclease family protein [Bacteroidales bacterium]